MHYDWTLPDSVSRAIADGSGLNIPSIIEKLLVDRGIDNRDRLREFVDCPLSGLHDPFLMRDMHKAVDRVINALQDGEQVLIYGDYDVDGVTGVSVLYDSLHRLGGKISFYIPSRLTEGYGLSMRAIDGAARRKVGLIITVDCGITANEEIAYANEKGIDVIICDHHQVAHSLPPAYAILNPKLEKSGYPYTELAGCGVAFKLLQGINSALGFPPEKSHEYLDLVAIGTAADIVDVLGENRIILHHGLKKINNNPRPGIEALMRIAGVARQTITVSIIVFVLAPRINAVGRISNAKKAVHLVTSVSPQQAKNIAQILNVENRKRKDIDELTFKEADEYIQQHVDLEKTHILVLARENWHLGVIGIVASRLLEKYNRPTVLISTSNGVGKASARSTIDFNIFNAFRQLESLLLSYGGHACASGLSIATENIDQFREKINILAQASGPVPQQKPPLDISAEIKLGDFDGNFFHWLKLMAPYGPNHMRPVFVSRGLKPFGDVVRVGGNHLKFKLGQAGMVIDAIAYNMAEYIDILSDNNSSFDFAYVIEEINWQGKTTIQLRVKDFEVADGTES